MAYVRAAFGDLKGDAHMPNFLYEEMYSAAATDDSYKRTQKGKKKYTKEAILYDACRETNLMELRSSIRDRTYRPGKYGFMIVKEPKVRVIHYPKLQDKVVQFNAHRILKRLYEPVYVDTTYACLEGRGTYDAIRKIQHNMRYVKHKYGDAWIAKLDLRKYYYSIDREVTKQLYRKKIPKDEVFFLEYLDMVVDSSPEPDGKGHPLGNVCSQDFGNITGNEIDQFAIRYKHYKYYVRYMDDIIMVFPTKAEAQTAIAELEAFVSEHLHLETNEKTRVFPVAQGVKTLGVRIYITHILLQDKTIQAMKRRMKEIDRKVKAREMSEKQAQNEVNSWLGHARHTNSFKLCQKIFAPYPYIKFEDKNWRFGDRSPKEWTRYEAKTKNKKEKEHP